MSYICSDFDDFFSYISDDSKKKNNFVDKKNSVVKGLGPP